MRKVVISAVIILASFTCTVVPSVAQQRVAFGIGGMSSIAYLPFTIAEKKGFFRDAGLTVDFNNFQGGPRSVEALAGGSIDFAVATFEYPLLLQAKGVELLSVAVINRSIGNVIALRKPLAATYKSPRDLKGLKIGATSPGSFLARVVQYVLAKDGLTLDDVSIIGLGAGGGAVAMVKAGRVDAISHTDPVIGRLVADDEIVPVIDARKREGMEYIFGGDIAASTVMTSAAFLRKNPAAVQSFVNGVTRALDWMRNQSVDQIMEVVPAEYYIGNKSDYGRMLSANMPIFTSDGIMDRTAIDTTIKFLVATKTLEHVTQEQLAKAFDNRFAESAAAAIHPKK